MGCLVGCLLLGAVPAAADDNPDATGPSKVTLSNNLGTMEIPKGYVWLGEAKAKSFMEKNGSTGDTTIGLIAPTDEDAKFLVELEYEGTGYVEDKDAGKIDSKAILESYQEGTEANNDNRKEKGMPPIHVTGWEQEPKYDGKHHVVTWSLQGNNDSTGKFVNYNTRVLTRKGVLSLNLLCSNEELAAARPKAEGLVTKVAFNQGERYEDYKQGDKISAGGLVALIAGGALLAKKTGIIAFLYVMLKPMLLFVKALGAKFLVLIAAAFAGLKNLIAGKKKSAEEPFNPSQDDVGPSNH